MGTIFVAGTYGVGTVSYTHLKPYNVAKMAAVNKFLRIYYARAMELYK